MAWVTTVVVGQSQLAEGWGVTDYSFVQGVYEPRVRRVRTVVMTVVVSKVESFGGVKVIFDSPIIDRKVTKSMGSSRQQYPNGMVKGNVQSPLATKDMSVRCL